MLARDQALGANIPCNLLESVAHVVQSAAEEVTQMTALLNASQIKLGDYKLSATMEGTIMTLYVDPAKVSGLRTC
ncbi:hypothetical protein Z949_1099 [Sulfitobacter guttiformis KCTC 32187]|uniref:Uncharacterized protein n=1 Tax=Sulfitobacter guttiformis TaxID=74349 RepID=A0A420DJ89_9RHOB|nr:hypothetical protein Z949_1099 [Sulfitobacter guttiformis KCTC 32187]RKE94264.1 hypothetical protein C8N30_3384 [Sulfitobacter guttiformis]